MKEENRAEAVQQSGVAPGAEDRPATMDMTIQSGMLKTLGINLYTSIAKVLVEFIANAYDSDATRIDIIIPHEKIASERKRLRESLKSASNGPSKELRFDILTQVLSEDVQITLKDDGHGMSTHDVRDKFLPLNRARRLDASRAEKLIKSESGKRFVMGRKGLGKLAGFGAAQQVRVYTKRAGATHATRITMNDDDIHKIEDLTRVPIPVEYIDGLSSNEHGTEIIFARLKSDALKDSLTTIKTAIARSFHAIRPEDFTIYINGEKLAPEIPDYEFIYPAGMTIDRIKTNDLAADSVSLEDLGVINFRYYVGFRKRKEHLAAKERGARIYCNNRLAAGPTVFGLGTGMHSFHSQDYMECIVEADELDRGSVDLINTSRTQFKEGNEISDGMSARITELMKSAIADHAKFREDQAKREMENDPKAKMLNRVVENLPRKTRDPAKRLLNTIAAEYGVGTDQFELLAPLVVNTVNASEVLIKLIHLGSKPETLDRVAKELRELAEIEKVDALKHYRARRSGIQALLALEQKGEDQWGKKQIEKELHLLLKQNPWLIRPEFSSYLTSDADLNKVVSKIAKSFNIDAFAPILDQTGAEDETRPDLVFLMSDPMMEGPFVLNIVELKSPSKALAIEHWDQLDEYIFKVEAWCRAELKSQPSIHGYLIGAMPPENTISTPQQRLTKKFRESTPSEKIRIIGIRQLIKEALSVHVEAIKTLEHELQEEIQPKALESERPTA